MELINQEISDELQKIPAPGWFDLLPFALVRWIYAIITFIPVFTEFINEKISEKLQERRELREEVRSRLLQIIYLLMGKFCKNGSSTYDLLGSLIALTWHISWIFHLRFYTVSEIKLWFLNIILSHLGKC